MIDKGHTSRDLLIKPNNLKLNSIFTLKNFPNSMEKAVLHSINNQMWFRSISNGSKHWSMLFVPYFDRKSLKVPDWSKYGGNFGKTRKER